MGLLRKEEVILKNMAQLNTSFCTRSPHLSAGLPLKAREAQDDLVKTKEELHLVMTAPPPPPPAYEPVGYHVQDSLQDEGTENSGYSAELSSEGILDDRNEEKRITEAEKNERVQRQLMVSGGGGGGAAGAPPQRSPVPLASRGSRWPLGRRNEPPGGWKG